MIFREDREYQVKHKDELYRLVKESGSELVVKPLTGGKWLTIPVSEAEIIDTKKLAEVKADSFTKGWL